ncbi:phytanoyl-CoA dioxygenase family protein [Pseudoalteromonas sp. BSi20439]|uniref:phytanoyl-CoA dioxygenase family protein n=1 Tax=Pseudoalteromonas sp. BSi20439 TaxID=420915 RepID=UPI000231B7B4|nr:phytanoyl-CoA dioxygenase family protein [Pseudoalteromonas sp. BSi20439]GAA72651.1 hypothetical protein P20439_2745 [Pseudoalteromonas sp. BSi20439]
MNLLIVLLKELLESALRNIRLVRVQGKDTSINKTLNRDGIVVESNFFNSEQCKYFRDKIDSYIYKGESNVWQDDLGADNRVYFINEIDSEFEKFYSNPLIRNALLKYTGTSKPNGMLLAARIDAKEGNLGSGGGWHRDSPITHQFKAICYLSDVGPSNGPFQYIKGSHSKMNVIKSYLKKIFKAGQYRFTEKEIKNYLSYSKTEISDMVAPEGTLVFADTKGLHRGKPIEKGSRYVLFCYFWDGVIPKHFEKLRQK